jgi:transcriptional regulator with XRE-family HTH domain
MTTFDNIKKIANTRGLNLKETAIKAGLSENALYRYNQGIEPKYPTLKKIAAVLHVSVSDLSDKYKKSDIEKPKSIDLADTDVLMTYQGRPIPPEELEMVRRMLGGGK